MKTYRLRGIIAHLCAGAIAENGYCTARYLCDIIQAPPDEILQTLEQMRIEGQVSIKHNRIYKNKSNV